MTSVFTGLMAKACDINKVWAYVACGVLGYFQDLATLVFSVLLFIMADFVTGCWASLNEGHRLNSHKLRRTITKLTTYMLCIVLLDNMDNQVMTFAVLHLAKMTSILICSVELYSIFENLYRITGLQVFKILTHFTKHKLEKVLGDGVNDGR